MGAGIGYHVKWSWTLVTKSKLGGFNRNIWKETECSDIKCFRKMHLWFDTQFGLLLIIHICNVHLTFL